MDATLISLIVCHLLNIVALLFLLYLLDRNVMISAFRILAYRITIVLTVTVLISEICSGILDTLGHEWWALNFFFNIVGFSASAAIPYTLASTYDESLLRKKRVLFALPAAVYAVLCLLSIKTGWLFTVSRSNVYSRGPLFWIYVLVYTLGLCLLLFANWHQSRLYGRRERTFLAFLFFFTLAGLSVQLFFPAVHSSWQCVTLCLLLYYIFQRETVFHYDFLSGVLNRAAFEKELTSPCYQYRTLAVFDLDNFKEINDNHGHQEGDRSLGAAARILQKHFSSQGNCYRIGGDEFAVFSLEEQPAFEKSIQGMLCDIRSERKTTPWFPNISYGFCSLQSAGSASEAFRIADEQMYLYKRQQIKDARRVHFAE